MIKNTKPSSHPVLANADGSVSAPVPTIKLNKNTKPIYFRSNIKRTKKTNSLKSHFE